MFSFKHTSGKQIKSILQQPDELTSDQLVRTVVSKGQILDLILSLPLHLSNSIKLTEVFKDLVSNKIIEPTLLHQKAVFYFKNLKMVIPNGDIRPATFLKPLNTYITKTPFIMHTNTNCKTA